MRKTYNAKLIELDKKGYSVGDIVKVIGNSFDKKIVSMATTDAVYSSIYQAQRLVITDETGMLIAAYPQIPNITYKIDLSDIRRWIEMVCKESVELLLDDVYNEPYIGNNTVKMVWGEQDKAQPIAGAIIGSIEHKIWSLAYESNSDEAYRDVIKRVQELHHPATDWDALRDKLKELCKCKININDDGIDGIINFFKQNIK